MFHIFLKYLLPLLHFFRYGHGRSLCFSLLSFNESIVAAMSGMGKWPAEALCPLLHLHAHTCPILSQVGCHVCRLPACQQYGNLMPWDASTQLFWYCFKYQVCQ